MRALVVVLLMTQIAFADAKATTKTAIESRFAKDAKAKTLAVALFNDLEHVVERGDDEVMDGGYRGKIHLVPQLPASRIASSSRGSSAALHVDRRVLRGLDPKAPSYRWRALTLRVRALGRQANAERVCDGVDDHAQRVGSLLDERTRRARDVLPRAVPPQRFRSRRLVAEDARARTTRRS